MNPNQTTHLTTEEEADVIRKGKESLISKTNYPVSFCKICRNMTFTKDGKCRICNTEKEKRVVEVILHPPIPHIINNGEEDIFIGTDCEMTITEKIDEVDKNV